jgi:hypothetical protein
VQAPGLGLNLAVNRRKALWRRIPFAVRCLLATSLAFGIVWGDWWYGAMVLLAFACMAAVQRGLRLRAIRRGQAAHAAGDGEWIGWIDRWTAEWLWLGTEDWRPGDCPLDGVAARIRAGARGLTVSIRGPISSRRYRPASFEVPWADVAGVRDRGQGYVTPADNPTFARLTAVTIDLVGRAAAGWREEYVWTDAEVAECEDDVSSEDVREFRSRSVENVEFAFPDRARGTAAFVFRTHAPAGLVEYVTARCQGRPDPSLDPEAVC